jgi:hypothetical protein
VLNPIFREDMYVEKHHITPKSLGGSNKHTNIVNLTAREHFICHILLTKFLEGQAKYKMLSAVTLMNRLKDTINSKVYEQAQKCKSTFKSYYNINDGKFEWYDVDPGEGWIKQGISRYTKIWHNNITNEYIRDKVSPGVEWVNEAPNKGTTYWYNSNTNEYICSFECPGEGWIKQGHAINKLTWYNTHTNVYKKSINKPIGEWVEQGTQIGTNFWYNESKMKYTTSKISPGDGWVKQGPSKDTLFWYNDKMDTYTSARNSPGDDWERRGVNTNKHFWMNVNNGDYTTSVDSPGDDWIKQGPNIGTTSWTNTVTGECVRTTNKPSGCNWINKGSHGGTRSGTFKGYYCHTKYGEYPSAGELSEAIGNIGTATIIRIINKLDNKISKSSYTQGRYLQSIGSRDVIVGQTWRDVGFYFIPKDKY